MKLSLPLFCIAIAALVFTSCSKHKAVTGSPVLTPAGSNITKDLTTTSLEETQQALEGRWYLLESSGGFAGQSKKYNGVYHAFGKSIFTIDDNHKVSNIPCKWEEVKSIHSGDDVWQMTYGGSGISFLRIVNDTLYTSDNAYDGYSSSYLKVK